MSEPNLPVQSSQLEQYLLLAKTAKGRAAAELVVQVIEAPGVYVFGELLDMPNMKELESSHLSHWELLKLFAFGTYSDYVANKDKFPPLSQAMVNKLRHLTVVSLATKNKRIPYDILLKELEMKHLRELEDLIIEVIYADVVRGKLDQRNNWLEVNYTIGRDIRAEDVGPAIKVLQDWCEGCESLLSAIESQMKRANTAKRTAADRKAQIEAQQAFIRHEQSQMMQQGQSSSSTSSSLSKKSQQHNRYHHHHLHPLDLIDPVNNDMDITTLGGGAASASSSSSGDAKLGGAAAAASSSTSGGVSSGSGGAAGSSTSAGGQKRTTASASSNTNNGNPSPSSGSSQR